jgi:hypothetical protein
LPAGVPAADVLSGYPELAGDLSLGATGSKQHPGLHADTFERLAVTQTTGVAAVGSWSHPARLPGQPPSCHRKGRTSVSALIASSYSKCSRDARGLPAPSLTSSSWLHSAGSPFCLLPDRARCLGQDRSLLQLVG